jgi:hypothetical protein
MLALSSVLRIISSTRSRFATELVSSHPDHPGIHIDGSSIAFFGSESENALFGMIGSPESFIGAARNDSKVSHSLDGYSRALCRFADEAGFLNFVKEDPGLYYVACSEALRLMPKKTHHLEFLARTLERTDGFLLATPIYVAFR